MTSMVNSELKSLRWVTACISLLNGKVSQVTVTSCVLEVYMQSNDAIVFNGSGHATLSVVIKL